MSAHEQDTGRRMVDVTLVGGPADLPPARRTLRIDAARARQKIKIEHYGGYQHFEPSAEPGEDNGQEPVVFRWTGFTKIAE